MTRDWRQILDPGETYPGSKQRRHGGNDRLEPHLESVEDPLEGFPSTVYNVGNVATRFWGIGVLAHLLGRKPGTIRKWENDKVIPKAEFQISNDDKDPRSRRRLYTRSQIMGIWRIAMDEGLLDTNGSGMAHKHISGTSFSIRVWDGWPEWH